MKGAVHKIHYSRAIKHFKIKRAWGRVCGERCRSLGSTQSERTANLCHTKSTVPVFETITTDIDSEFPGKHRAETVLLTQTTWHDSFTRTRPKVELEKYSKNSRTHIRKKELLNFIRELDLYLQASQNTPRSILVITPSATSTSANTIVELEPYHSEFQSAGLAVTSAEQKRHSKNSIVNSMSDLYASQWTSI